MSEVAKFLIIIGGSLVVLGVVLLVIGRIPGIGQLPGDFQFQRGNFTVNIPLATMIVVSIILTVLLNLAARLWR